MTDVRVIRFEPQELITCHELLLADSMLKDYCDFICDGKLKFDELKIDHNKLVYEDDAHQRQNIATRQQKPLDLCLSKQLILVRSCLADVLYAIHCLGSWCAKRTIKMYITEFARILHSSKDSDGPLLSINLLASALSILQCFHYRLDELTSRLQTKLGSTHDDLLKHGSSQQLRTLLHYLKDHEPPSGGTWPICIVHVHRKVIAKVIALWLREISSKFNEYSFIKPNYIVGSSRKHRNRMAIDNFDLHHEASIRDFRFGKCNTLIISSMNERCADMLRCNLVLSFDCPTQFTDYMQAKINCRNDSSKYIVMLNDFLGRDLDKRILDYINMEKILNSSNKRDILDQNEVEILKSMEKDFPPFPPPIKGTKSTPATVMRGVSIINKYCAKLPSDSFTKLSPDWTVEEIQFEGSKKYFCKVKLPINSPVRQTICGPLAPTKGISIRLAAFAACKVLYCANELDNNMLPIKKDSMKSVTPWIKGYGKARQPLMHNNFTKSQPTTISSTTTKSQSSIGSTRHRQYYKKRIARAFSSSKVTDNVDCFLYKFKMILTCPIPDEQNRRGRRIIDPSETNRNYAIICSERLPQICSFPVFTRSGEVMISVECVDDRLRLTKSHIADLRTFHAYTFSKVLRLDKYPTVYDPENSPFTVLLAPVVDDEQATIMDVDEKFHGDSRARTWVDWEFVEKIVKSDHGLSAPDISQRERFKFNYDDYVDAVVIPWYRLTDRQQFAYYVAEICTNMNPMSPFPDESSGFNTFVDYYNSKYDICIYNKEQPVLDVDHTSARLNLLTPRYVNRKGKTLPSSTAKTRRESRESLDRKQLLIPELCTIHPFPASFWRKAVCLPAIFYRLNSLFLAEELRREVASAIKVGFVEPPIGFSWPNLDFGWSLKDVINQSADSVNVSVQNTDHKTKFVSIPTADDSSRKKDKKTNSARQPDQTIKSNNDAPVTEVSPPSNNSQPEHDFVIDYFDPTKLNIPDIPLDSLPDEWMNIKIISTDSSKSGTKTGWDQELKQHDILLRHPNEINWDDCEMNFDGEVYESVPEVRCASPSNFEPIRSNLKYTEEPTKNQPHIHPHARVIQFCGQNGDDHDDDDGDYYEDYTGRSTFHNSGKFVDYIQQMNADSDSTWSSSDDEHNEEDENDHNVLYGDWRDEKAKRQALLRELFVPYVKSYPTASAHKKVEELYEKLILLEPSERIRVSKEHDYVLTSAAVNFLDRIELVKTREQVERSSGSILSSFFEGVFYNSPERLNIEFESWHKLYNELNFHVERTLGTNPDLFKDNDIELIPAIDETPLDLNLDAQPTFGQLLPNREISRDTWPSEGWKNIKFDPTRNEVNSNGPGPSVILQALTMSNASDGINLERLETVGDSFLKYSITAYLYCMYPKLHEGKLSYLRSTEISNANLYQLGKAKNLGEIMSATKFEPNDNWLPPGYDVPDSKDLHDSDGGGNDQNALPRPCSKKKEIDKALAEVPYDLLRQHSIPDKSVADCVEALIGAYLTASGSRAALLFMQWLGLRVVPPSFDLEGDLRSDEPSTNIWRWLEIPPSPLIFSQPSYESFPEELIVEMTQEQLKMAALEELSKLYKDNNMDKFEEEIGYSFRDKAYLVQAFTHNSFYENHVTDCHQRLEFLGDALLDYLITRYLFEDPRCHSPGTLTDLRSALVNNTFFASLAVKYNFHRYLKYISDDLSHAIEDLVRKFRFNTKDTITKGYTLLIGEGESEYAEDIEVPKALGDVFESVAGAIYLDSGMSLDQVWQVYFKMMKPEIEYFSRNVPKSPIRELLESKPQNVRFSPSELAPDKKHRVTAEVFGLGRFTGVGRSKHSAKSTAAKRALRMLEIRKNADKNKHQRHGRESNESSSEDEMDDDST